MQYPTIYATSLEFHAWKHVGQSYIRKAVIFYINVGHKSYDSFWSKPPKLADKKYNICILIFQPFISSKRNMYVTIEIKMSHLQ